MIGVIADPSEEGVIREFFELFKTPWELYHSNRRYEVLLCTRDCGFDGTAKLALFYAGRKVQFDGEHDIWVAHQRTQSCVLLYEGKRIPVYGETVVFSEGGENLLRDERSRQSAAYVKHSGEKVLARIGYDLFGEVRKLLTVGQPFSNAAILTLDLHIALLRDLVTGSGIPLVEIPPVPEGYRFMACLTHDVDHPSIRKHRWDHTMFGFVYRAVLGSVGNFIEGRLRFRDLIRNWAAALKLPFVYLGLTKDFWRKFDDRYLELEKGLCSTFFVIAFKNYSGESSGGRARKLRASRYDARDIADTIRKLLAAGCEIGVHGVDAWLDSPKGREEFAEIRRLTGVSEIGVRMHWLYYDQQSPVALEKAGAAYDSTIGYNETVGYHAGTMQAYKPLQATRLLELPLHVMDTALFNPAYLGLSPSQARITIDRMIHEAIQFGGCLTINWHDRSIFPERLWETCYRELVEDLKIRGAWFSTAGQAVAWFRKRRVTVFETDCTEPEAVCAKVTSDDRENLPRLRLRIHRARESWKNAGEPEGYIDIPFDNSIETPSATRLAHE